MRIKFVIRALIPQQGAVNADVEIDMTPEEHSSMVTAYKEVLPEVARILAEALNASNERPIFN